MKRQGLIYGAICAACTGCVLALYRVEMEAFLYALGLCLFVGAVFWGLNALDAHRRREKLRFFADNTLLSEALLPTPRSKEEKAYQAIICALRKENAALRTSYAQTLREMQDDYTLWAHQIKTPIAALRLLLGERADEGAREEELELMRIEGYVEMALSVQRLSQQSSDLQPKEYDLDAIIRKTVRKYSRLFIRKHLYLHYEMVAQRVLTDEKWLCFILEQILTNALKYTDKGGIDISMQGNDLLIRDTGIGIAADDLPRVFERGYTGYHGREEQHATGMGLYLCRRAAQLLGHQLTIESILGKGTLVRIRFQPERLRVE